MPVQVEEKFRKNLEFQEEGAHPVTSMRHAKNGNKIISRFTEKDTIHDYIRLGILIVAMYGAVLLMGAMKMWGWF